MEMLEWVGHAIAMGQAGNALKEVADVVTASIVDDGLALALEEYFDV